MEIVQVGQERDSEVVAVNSDIVKNGEEAQIEASGQLLVSLRQMVNEPAFSDVVFLCKDGIRVHGSRMLLSGISEVLKSMLMNGMAESRQSEINMPDISSPVLLSVFEFLYTGTLLDYCPQTWTITCEVIGASRFFLLPNLEKITRKLMHAQTVRVAKDLPKVASLLTEAVRFEDLREEPDVNLGELVKLLSSSLTDCTFLELLSEDAFDYLLRNSKSSVKDDDVLSFEEYLRFKQVIRWILYQSGWNGTPSVDQLLDSIVPPEKEALSLCRGSDNDFSPKIETPQTDIEFLAKWSSLLQDGVKQLKQPVHKLMSNIDCRKIHPILLAKVVEPTKITSADQIMSALRFHALRRTMILSRLEFGWKHGEFYQAVEQEYKIKKIGNQIGVAVATLPMARPFGVYQWQFTLEEGCEAFCEFGFTKIEARVLEYDRLSRFDSSRVVRVADPGRGRQVSISWKDGGGRRNLGMFIRDTNWKALEPVTAVESLAWTLKSLIISVTFTYNASNHTCSLSICGRDYGPLWKNIPRATYYPAVCLGDSSSGLVRIDLLSGFDIL